MLKIATGLAATLIGLGLAGSAAAAERTCPPGMPAMVHCGAPDPAQAPAGTYNIDPNHVGVIARVSHIGYSYSVFRFDKVAGTLEWNPAAPGTSKLTATVQTGSIATNVANFAAELSGARYLNSAAFPTATFVSTAFRRTDATHGKVDGQFTLLGKSHAVTFDVTLVGAGKGFGKPRLGATAHGTINPQDYGMPAMFSAPIDLTIDAEFEKTTP